MTSKIPVQEPVSLVTILSQLEYLVLFSFDFN